MKVTFVLILNWRTLIITRNYNLYAQLISGGQPQQIVGADRDFYFFVSKMITQNVDSVKKNIFRFSARRVDASRARCCMALAARRARRVDAPRGQCCMALAARRVEAPHPKQPSMYKRCVVVVCLLLLLLLLCVC